MNDVTPDQVLDYLKGLQHTLCSTFSIMDGKPFGNDSWQRTEGGGGTTRMLEDGNLFEAMGLSLVFHPRNPYIPTTHANIRFFIATGDNVEPVWWFGGGFDLTPYYGFVEDCVHWHKTAEQALKPFGESLYPRFKAWCDNYFYLKHRNEARGIGGIFFDDFDENGFDNAFAMMQSVGDPYGERETQFQRYRRGRYVEFNLVHDRGTLFGLQSGGRTESILMSMPPSVNWRYDWHPKAGSAEAALYDDYLIARDWLKLDQS